MVRCNDGPDENYDVLPKKNQHLGPMAKRMISWCPCSCDNRGNGHGGENHHEDGVAQRPRN